MVFQLDVWLYFVTYLYCWNVEWQITEQNIKKSSRRREKSQSWISKSKLEPNGDLWRTLKLCYVDFTRNETLNFELQINKI